MRHTAEKRFLSMLIVVVMVLAMLPVSALAKSSFNTTVLDGKFTVVTTDGTSGQKAATVNADGSLTMAVTSVTGCTGSFESVATHTVTITNVTAEDLMIKFDYGSLTNLGTFEIDGVAKTIAASYSKTLSANETIVLKLTSASNATQTSVVLSGFELKDTSTKAVTVTKTENGSVTVNGTALSGASVTINADYATGVNVAATPASGYVFVAWLDSNYKVVSTDATTLIQPLEDMIVGAYFVPNDTQAYWLAAGAVHTDLNTACTAAQGADKTVVLLKNGTLPSGTHTIPADVSVLIPFDAAHTSYGTGDPELAPNNSAQKFVAPTAYRTLTMASGANLVVNGTLELAAKHHVSAGHDTGSNGGAIWGKYGHIDMAANSNIIVNGNLCAWGVVSGQGVVTANSGGTIYEKMQIADYRGGSATSGLATTYASRKLFPFSQYYVQNVEVLEVINAGASLVVNVGVYLSAAEQSNVTFVGSSGAMFNIGAGGYVTKQYDAANDRLKLDAYGNTTLSSISLSFEGQSVDSSSFRLGLNNNIDIHIHSGVTTISQDVVLQAGATVTIDRDAVVYNTGELFVMDAEDWGTFARGKTIIPVMWSYANGTTVKRTSVTDAVVDINGTIINGGQLYSTGSDSFISSGKTGVIVYNSPANSSATLYQLDHNSFTLGMTSDWEQIACTPAVLVNGDKTTVTASGAQYDAFIYDSFEDKWIQKNIYNGGSGYTATATYNVNGGTGSAPAAVVMDYLTQVGAFAQTGALAPLSFAITDAIPTREGYTFKGWSTDAAAAEAQVTAGDYVAIAADTTLYAVWSANSYSLTVDGVSQDVPYGTDLSTVITEPTKDGFKFTGWTVTKADGTTITEPATMPAFEVIFTSNWEQAPTYSLTFLDENGSPIYDELLEEGEPINVPSYAAVGYTFKGWLNTATGKIETVPTVMPAQELEYQAIMERITYTITFKNNGADCGEVTVNYGEKATLLGALSHDTLVFQGWGETADAVTYAAGATIDVTGDMTLHAVWHSHDYSESVTTEPGCESEGVKTFSCSCGYSYTQSIPATGHTPETVPGYAADCENTGLTDGEKCSVCGEILTAQEEIAALGHTPETVPGYAADCENTGLTDGEKCSVCNKTLTEQEEIAALGHSYSSKVTTAPGCESAGTLTFTCDNCGDTYTEPLASTGHNHVAGTPVPPTCTEKGYTTYTCPCGDTYDADYVDALGHTPETVPGYAADCENTGLTDGEKCSVCGEILTEQEEIAALGHTSEIIPGTPADCENTGLTDGEKCSVCGEILTEQEEIAALGHTPETVPGYAADCENTGLTDGEKCSVCNKTLTEQEEIAALGHTSEIIPGTPADCENTGLTDGEKCSVCGEILTEQEEIAALGHTPETVPGYAADCENTGLTDGEKCSVCGEILTEQEEIAALGHTPETVPGYAADCENTGLTDGEKCSVCDEILTAQEEIPALGHKGVYYVYTSTRSWDNYVCYTGSETELVDSIKVEFECEACGELFNSAGEIVFTGRFGTCTKTDATCTEDGIHTHTIDASIYAEIEGVDWANFEPAEDYEGWNEETKTFTQSWTLAATGHAGETVPGYAAGCESTGLTDGEKCSVCGEILTEQTEIPATGHSFVNGGCENCDAEIQVSLPGSFNGWDTSAWIMTRNEDGTYTYQVHLDAGSYTFKVMDDGNWLGNYGTISDDTDGYEWIFGDAGDCTLSASGGTYTFIYNINTKGLKVEAVLDHVHDYTVTFNWSDYYTTCSAEAVCSCGSYTENCTITKTLENGKLSFTATYDEYSDTVTVDADNTNVIYVDVSAMGWTNVNAYCWNSQTNENMATWPGTAMTYVSGSVYSIMVPDGFDMIIFNNGSAQTNNQNMPVLGENIAVVKSSSDTDFGYMDPPTYSITFTDEPGYEMAQWSYTITKPYGAPITEEDLAALEAAIPTVENYNIVDWYLTDETWTEIPATMPGYDQTFYAYWEGVRSIVYFYSDPSMSEDSYLTASEFVYDETYGSLAEFVECNCIDDYVPEGYHVAAIKYADGTEMQFPYTHGTEGFDLYVEFVPNACETHTEETVPGYAATCTEPGLTDGVKCSVCGEIITAQEEIPALGHSAETVPGYAATCTETGMTDGSKCSVCGETLVAQEVIPATGHSFVDGICSVCGAEQYMTIYFQNNWLWSDVKLHFWGSETDTNPEWEGVPMTYYDTDGTYDYYVMEVPTDIDGMVINGVKNDGTGTRDQTPDITSGWYDGICYYLYWGNGSNQAGSFNISEVEFACKHHNQETVFGYAATCTEPGLTDGVKCSDCGETITAQEVIPALGHGHTEGISYEEGDNTHDVFCDDCFTTIEWNVECTYAEDTHACVCGNVETFTIEWYDFGTFKSETYKYGETVIGPEPVSEVTEQGKNTFLFWYDLNDGTEVTLPMTMPAKNLQLQAAYSYTGWAGVIGSDYYTFWIDSMEVQGWFNVNENNEPVGEGEGKRYYAGEDYNVVNTITLIDGVYYAFDVETGAFLGDYTGIYEARNGDLYYVENGIAVENKGLVKTTDDNGHIHYYYFGCGVENCSAGDACQGNFKAQKSNRHYAAITNGYLMEGGYTTDKFGVIEHIEDTSVNGIYEIEGVKYCLMDGVKVAKGLFEENGKFYYARSSGALVIGQDYWVSKTNGLTHNGEAIKAGTYTFDETGAIVFPVVEIKNGFYYENGGWFYYVDNQLNYAGLIYCDGPEGNDPGYYYVNSKCQLVTDCAYWISKNNGYMKNTTYYFDENGTMYDPAPKNGFYFENDAWYYYVDGELNYAGLIWCDGPEGNDPGYYYVNSKCMLITGCDYWISKNNGYMKNQTYTFDANGTMVQETNDSDELLEGFVEENGELYYYEDGIKTYAGLILVDGDYYYVNSKGRVVRDCTYWISKNNGYMKNGNYTFDAEGKLILN